MTAQLVQRVEAAAFALAMLAFCAWLHAAISAFGWLARRQPVATPAFAVEAVGVLLVAVAVPAVLGRPVYRLMRLVLRAGAGAAAVCVLRLMRRRDKAPLRMVSGGAR